MTSANPTFHNLNANLVDQFGSARSANRDFAHILLFVGQMSLGGIETLVARVARTLSDRGFDVSVFHSGGDLAKELPDGVAQLVYSSAVESAEKFSSLADAIGGRLLVISFDPTTAALASWSIGKSKHRGDVRHITGIFHPRAYFLDGEDKLRFAINRLIMASFADNQFFFMNRESLDAHSRWARRRFNSPILPLSIDYREALYKAVNRPEFRIVSVGRLVAFKDYNLEAPKIVEELRRQDIPVCWDIYGTGELEPIIRGRIEQLGLGKWVRLCGNLPYARFEDVARFDVFVGMGTAALEAAMLGVPTVMAVESQGDRIYGFLQDLPFGNVGELQEDLPNLSLAEILLRTIRSDCQHRILKGQESRSAALRYSAVHYADELLRIGALSRPVGRLRSRLSGSIYLSLTIGRTRKVGNWVVRKIRRMVGR